MNISNKSLLKASSIGLDVLSRNCSLKKSALFIPNRIRTNITPSVDPYLNITKTLTPIVDDMQQSLSKRIQRNGYDLKDIIKSADRLNQIEWEEARLFEIRDQTRILISEEKDQSKIEKLKEDAKELKESLKKLRNERWEIEETTLIEYVRLPNTIHENTPMSSEDEIIFHIGDKPEIVNQNLVRSHHELCHKEIEFSENSPTSYYLFGDVAKLEMSLNWAAQDFLLSNGFQMCAGPDFTRSAIVEGCNPDINLFQENNDDERVFSLAPTSDFGDISTHAATHLVGSASFESLISHYIKNVIINSTTSLPQAYFCCGRSYSPVENRDKTLESLYNVQQSSAVEFISIAKNASSLDDQMKDIECKIKKFYSGIGLHCLLIRRHVGKLEHAGKSMKISVMIYSPYGEKYVEVGCLNVYSDFVSRRLLTLYEDEVELGCLYILNGTFMNVTKMVGCVIENCQVEKSNINEVQLKQSITAFIKNISP